MMWDMSGMMPLMVLGWIVVIAAIVERAIAAAGGLVAGRRCASDIAEAGLAREFAAAAPGG